MKRTQLLKLQVWCGLSIILLTLVLTACTDTNNAPTATTTTTTGVATTVANGSVVMTAAANTSSTTTASTNGAATTTSGSNNATTTAATTTTATSTTSTTASATTPTIAAVNVNNIPDATTLKNNTLALLPTLWQTYKSRYVQQDGRVVDPQTQDASTSEGESYALLRSVWQNDQPTFDAALKWTHDNLELPRGDNLFAYLWGRNPDNSWKVIDKNDATDADEDIAFALILAAQQWQKPEYQQQAVSILQAMWQKTVVTVNGQPYLTAGDWSPVLAKPVLNPSYLAPYEYRIFAQVDPNKNDNWLALVNTSYQVIQTCTTNKLDASAGTLPPNWCAIDKQSGQFVAATDQGKDFSTDFGYDAFRTIWRVALDYRWNNDSRALNYLKSLQVLQNDWQKTNTLGVDYTHSGSVVDNYEDLGIYSVSGVTLFSVINPQLANQVVATRILPNIQNIDKSDPDPAHINAAMGRTYYAQNWAWFGLAFYTDSLPRPSIGSVASTQG